MLRQLLEQGQLGVPISTGGIPHPFEPEAVAKLRPLGTCADV